MAPDVLLFDEAKSMLDVSLEASLCETLETIGWTKGTAVLTVAHRLATARHPGRIVDASNPEALVQQSGRFAALLEIEVAGWAWRVDKTASRDDTNRPRSAPVRRRLASARHRSSSFRQRTRASVARTKG